MPPLTVPGATFEYHSTLTLSEQYSDNFNLNSSAQGKTSNFRTTLSPGSTILVNTAKIQGSLTATSGFTYDSSSGSSGFQAFPSLSAAFRYTYDPRLNFTVTDSFNLNDNPNVADSTGLRQQRQTYISNTFGVYANWLIDLLQTQYYYRNSLFVSNTHSSSNTSTLSQVFGVNASTQVGALNTVRVGYEYSINEPQQGTTSYGNLVTASLSHQLGQYASVGVQGSYTTQTLDNLQIWNGSVFGTYGLPTGFSFSGSVGYSLLDSNITSNQSGWSGNGFVSYAHAWGAISLGIFQDYRTTYQGGFVGQTGADQAGQNFGVVQTTGLTGSFTYQLTPFIGSFINGTYTQNKNTGIGNTKSNSDQNYITANTGINWSLLRWLNLNLTYTYNQYNQPYRTQNQGLVSLTAAF